MPRRAGLRRGLRGRRLETTVYDISPEVFGTFDLVLFLGTLYHLRYPLLALDKLSAVCSGTMIVESAVIDDFSPYRGLGNGYPGQQMVMEFYPNSEFGDNPTNWWAPTVHCLGHMMCAAGFEKVELWKLTEAPEKGSHVPRLRQRNQACRDVRRP